jgi:methionine synthase reductase
MSAPQDDVESSMVKTMLKARHDGLVQSLVVLYGSETGNSTSIAERIHSQAISLGLNCRLGRLDEYESFGLLGSDPVNLVIVCSTTGNGDAPKGAGKFFRWIKRRDVPADALKSVSYVVLALGDTNYDKFCFVGKTIDSRMLAVGATRLKPVSCADEVAGLDTVVEPFISSVWTLFGTNPHLQNRRGSEDAILKIKNSPSLLPTAPPLSSPDNKHTSATTTTILPPPLVLSSAVAALTTTTEHSTLLYPPIEEIGWKPSLSPLQRFDPSTIVVDFAHKLEKCNPARPRPPLPLSFKTNNGEKNLPNIGQQQQQQPESSSSSKLAQIISHRYLANHHDRIVIEAILRIPSQLEFQPGDAIEIFLPNPTYLVEGMSHVLKLVSENNSGSSNIVKLHTPIVLNGTITTTPHYILTNLVDLTRCPGKAFLRTMADYCSNVNEKNTMIWLSSASGKHDYETVIEAQAPTVLEILDNLFPSCHPSLEAFLGAMTPLQTSGAVSRLYSIANSPLSSNQTIPNTNTTNGDGKCVTIAFSVLKAKQTSSGRWIRGVCSNELERICTSSSSSNNNNNTREVHVNIKPSSSFKLPADDSRPIIMIGPGTGVAPFLGFIEHRPLLRESRLSELRASVPATGVWRGGLDFTDIEDELERVAAEEEMLREKSPLPIVSSIGDGGNGKSPYYSSMNNINDITNNNNNNNNGNSLGEAWLYYGCRYEHHDFLFKERLHEFHRTGMLSQLRVAKSREQKEKIYVQHLMKQDGKHLSEHILKRGAYVFVCGDGKNMAKDVHRTLIEILTEHGEEKSEEWAKAYIDDMQRRARYVQDIWS